MKYVVILSSWSSGSSAVAGFLDKCGLYSCPPHVLTNDQRTPSAYEPLTLVNDLRGLFDVLSLTQKGDFLKFRESFENFIDIERENAEQKGKSYIVLKHPLLSFLLPYIDKKLTPKYIVVTRPFEDIERTRQRRGWHDVYGKKGAAKIYNITFNYLIENDIQYFPLPYHKFLVDMEIRDDLINFLGVDVQYDDRKIANQFLTR